MSRNNELTSYLENLQKDIYKLAVRGTKKSAIHLQNYVKDLHGKQLPGYPPVNSNPTPLLLTGEMRDSVYSETTGLSLLVTTSEQRKAKWQEYGTTQLVNGIRKKRIPARRLWLRAENNAVDEVTPIFQAEINKINN